MPIVGTAPAIHVPAAGSGAFHGARLALLNNTVEAANFSGTVPFDYVMFDTDSIADIANHRFVVPSGMAGHWRFMFQLLFNSNGGVGWDAAAGWLYTGGTDGSGWLHTEDHWEDDMSSTPDSFDPYALLADSGPVQMSAATTVWVNFHTIQGATLGGSNDNYGHGAWCYFTAEYLG